MTKRVSRLSALLVGASLLTACAGIREHRGFVLDEQLASAIQVGTDNKASVSKTLGLPTFVSQFDANEWYYLSQNTTQFAFRNPRVKEQKLVRVRFDAAGNVASVVQSGPELIAAVNPAGGKTPTLGRKRSFFEELFGNIGTISQPGLPGANPGQ